MSASQPRLARPLESPRLSSSILRALPIFQPNAPQRHADPYISAIWSAEVNQAKYSLLVPARIPRPHVKAGFTKKKATLIDVNLINEAPVNFECKVTQIVELGSKGGAGNLVICEILKIHIDENVFDHDNKIDPLKLDIVSRLGLSWYGKTSVDSIFKIAKPMSSFGIGFDNLPNEIIESKVFTGHDLAMLASVDSIPAKKNKESLTLKTEEKHILAKKILKQGKIKEAWEILI